MKRRVVYKPEAYHIIRLFLLLIKCGPALSPPLPLEGAGVL